MIGNRDAISHRTAPLPWGVRTIAVAVVMTVIVAGCAGSGRVGQSTGVGAAFGAGVGLLMGALSGKPAEGLAAGLAVGASQGAYEGWRQEQDDERTRQLAAAIRETKSSGASEPAGETSSRAREELTRFLGVWSVEGWTMEGEQRYEVRAKANGNVEMSNYVELAVMDLQVNGQAATIWGEALLGYDSDVGYTYSSRINTLPEPFRATGQFDAASRTFTFMSQGDRMEVRFETPDRFTLETFSGTNKVESYRFTKS